MTRSSLALALALAFSLLACSKTPEPQKDEASSKPPPEPASSTTPPPAPVQSELAYTVPPSWTSAPNPSSMRKATFKVAKVGSDPEDAELSVSTAGGGVDQNIDRWAKQFGGATPAKEQRSPNGLKVTVVQLSGTFTTGGMMGVQEPPKAKWALLGAVVDLGSVLYFFKLTGPEATVNATKKDFDAFVASFQKK